MKNYLNLAALNLLVVVFVGLVIFTIINYIETNEIGFIYITMILIVAIFLKLLIKDFLLIYKKLSK